MDWRVGQAVDCLLCKCEVLSSNPSFTKKKKKRKKRRERKKARPYLKNN
jgi:hypothetical protein